MITLYTDAKMTVLNSENLFIKNDKKINKVNINAKTGIDRYDGVISSIWFSMVYDKISKYIKAVQMAYVNLCIIYLQNEIIYILQIIV